MFPPRSEAFQFVPSPVDGNASRLRSSVVDSAEQVGTGRFGRAGRQRHERAGQPYVAVDRNEGEHFVLDASSTVRSARYSSCPSNRAITMW